MIDRGPSIAWLTAIVLCFLAVSGDGRTGTEATSRDGTPSPQAREWRPLFNGRDLEGWTPKIRGHPVGEDPYRTFRVEDGLLVVRYDGYDRFDERFGHLFHATPFSRYRLLVEYRFVGRQIADGPAWARKNSGVMIHAQPPEWMGLGQDFPISLEAQLLGGDGSGPRPTANLCTPGTHIEIAGALVETHCIESSSRTVHDDAWVTVELVVDAADRIEHYVEGERVLEYARPVVGGGVVSGFEPRYKRDGVVLERGWIALQSESHPIDFRRIWIQELEPGRR